jgi:hypothetical protein
VRLACFTIAQDEDLGLHLWLEHYRKYAPTADLYILDHESKGSYALTLQALAAEYGAVVVPVKNGTSFNYGWLVETVRRFQQFLLSSYRWVCFSEIDELVWFAPGTLEDCVTKSHSQFMRAAGMNVVHKRDEEPDINWTAPVLKQRKYWYQSTKYSKICLAARPVQFGYGFHTAHNVPSVLPPVSELFLLHLHQADFKTTLRRHQNNAGKFWAPEFRRHELSVHQRLDNPEGLERYMLCDMDNPTTYAKLVEIPDQYKDAYAACLPYGY